MRNFTNIKIEEWGTFKLDDLAAPPSGFFDQILRAWEFQTGVPASGYFDVSATTLRPKFWCGTLESKNFKLEVLPMGSLSLSPESKNLLDRNLSHMVSYFYSGSVQSQHQSQVSYSGYFSDSLVNNLCNLINLSKRKKVVRRYEVATSKSYSPRGRLEFPKQINTSLTSPGKFSTSYVHLTDDIPEYRIIKEALKKSRLVCSPQVKGHVDLCLADLDSVGNFRGLDVELSQVRNDRISNELTTIIDICKSIILGNSSGLFSGGLSSNSNIIFTSRLYERYLQGFTNEVASSCHLKSEGQLRGRFFFRSDCGQNVFEAIPDLIINDSTKKPLLIMDAKWKKLKQSAKSFGISKDDIHQIISYASLFDTQHAALVYPATSGTEGRIGKTIEFTSIMPKGMKLYIIFLPMLTENPQSHHEILSNLLLKLRLENSEHSPN